MKNRTAKWITGISAAAVISAAGLTAAGCSNQLNDQGNIPQASPDYAVTIMNADNFPNITMVCFKGAGFATVTRDYDSAQRVPEWDAFCASKIPAGGQPLPAPSASASQSG